MLSIKRSRWLSSKCKIRRIMMRSWLVRSTKNKFRRYLAALANLQWNSIWNKWSRAMRTNPNSIQMAHRDLTTTKLNKFPRQISSWPMIMLSEATWTPRARHSSSHQLKPMQEWRLLAQPHPLPRENQLRKRSTRWKSGKRYSKRKSSKGSKRYRHMRRHCTCTWRSYSSHRIKRLRIIRYSRMKSLYK